MVEVVSEGVASLISLASDSGHYQAAKWLADAGWDVKDKGRPSKEAIEGELKKRADQQEEWNEGATLLELHRKEKK